MVFFGRLRASGFHLRCLLTLDVKANEHTVVSVERVGLLAQVRYKIKVHWMGLVQLLRNLPF